MLKETLLKNNKITLKNISLCPRCYLPAKNRKLIKCSGSCKCKYCFNCVTQIGNKFFCPDCLSNFIKDDVIYILTK